MGTKKQPPENRAAFSIGLPPEVQRVVRDVYLAGKASNPEMTMQDAMRELILRGAGLECDEAALATTRATLRDVVGRFLVRRMKEFLPTLEAELDTYLRSYMPSLPEEGDHQ